MIRRQTNSGAASNCCRLTRRHKTGNLPPDSPGSCRCCGGSAGHWRCMRIAVWDSRFLRSIVHCGRSPWLSGPQVEHPPGTHAIQRHRPRTDGFMGARSVWPRQTAHACGRCGFRGVVEAASHDLSLHTCLFTRRTSSRAFWCSAVQAHRDMRAGHGRHPQADPSLSMPDRVRLLRSVRPACAHLRLLRCALSGGDQGLDDEGATWITPWSRMSRDELPTRTETSPPGVTQRWLPVSQ
jgi:hypothetical protein